MKKFVNTSSAPDHLVGAFVKAHAKAIYASSRMHHGRKHRPTWYIHKESGHRFPVGHTRWVKAHDRWQKRFNQACKRLSPYDIFRTADLAP